MRFESSGALRAAVVDLPAADEKAAAAVAARQDTLTKPRGSLGRLETLVAWLARWQGREMPKLDKVEVLVFAGSHGVTAQGVSAFPAEVTAQMVANFSAGGAAINQISRTVGAGLRVIPLEVERATRDFTTGPAMDDGDFLAAVSAGYEAVAEGTDLLCLGEMGIGNTTTAAAIASALITGDPSAWVGRGTGVDDAGLARKITAIRKGFEANRQALGDPLGVLAALGGRELAAIFGATLAARQRRVPVLLDGFVSTAAAVPLAKLSRGGLDHCQAAHVSAEYGHRALLLALEMPPLLDLGMRLGEASGAALAVAVLRSALACHTGMASFAEAGVSNRDE